MSLGEFIFIKSSTHTLHTTGCLLSKLFDFEVMRFLQLTWPRTMDTQIPKSLQPKFKFKSQSQINMYLVVDIKASFIVEIMVELWKTWTRDSL